MQSAPVPLLASQTCLIHYFLLFCGCTNPPLFVDTLVANIFKSKEADSVFQNACFFCAEFKRKFCVRFIIKKFWEELIAYFPLLPHRPHRKRLLQQFIITAAVA
jgi:hypothetical protein